METQFKPPEGFGLRPAKSLPRGMTRNFGLDVPREAYDALTLDQALEVKMQQAERVARVIEELWQNRSTEFVVVCGPRVYTSSGEMADFDLDGFANQARTEPLLIPRPVTMCSPVSIAEAS